MTTAVEHVLGEPCLRDFAQRVRRMAMWEKNPKIRMLLISRAAEYERLARPAASA